jgi:indole-3-glycerol phosphate synthase
VSVLEDILRHKRAEVEERRREAPLEGLRERARAAPAPRSLAAALAAAGNGFRIIAEVKKASPSKGLIRADFDPVAIARAYERGGARGISVLTDEKHFQGSLEHLAAVRRAVALPLLRKDFIIDPYQVWEARAAGADAILLILAALPDDGLIARLEREANDQGMEVLWEVHDLDELRRLAPRRPRLVGINNRDLRTFEVSLETTRRLIPEAPPGALVVSESGFSRPEELARLCAWGAGAFLIGETLMRAPDPEAALRELVGASGREG